MVFALSARDANKVFQGITAIIGPRGLKGDQGDQGIQGTQGNPGKSVEFNVTETMLQYRYVGDTIWIDILSLSILAGDTGATGKSAYQSALDSGFVGTEAEWVTSLKGTDLINSIWGAL